MNRIIFLLLCLACYNLQQGCCDADDGYDDGYADDGNNQQGCCDADDGYDDGYADDGNNQQGCCSWHGGVCGCLEGSTLCCDDSLSPSCECGDDGDDDGYDDGYADDGNNQQGCCSWHGGVCGCSGGRTLCCDDSWSPSCECDDDDGGDDPRPTPGPTPSPTPEPTPELSAPAPTTESAPTLAAPTPSAAAPTDSAPTATAPAPSVAAPTSSSGNAAVPTSSVMNASCDFLMIMAMLILSAVVYL